MAEQGENRCATAWFGRFYDRGLRRRAATLYYGVTALVFAGLGVWALTPYAPFTPASAGMSASMKTVATILGSAMAFGVAIASLVSARRVNAEWRRESENN